MNELQAAAVNSSAVLQSQFQYGKVSVDSQETKSIPEIKSDCGGKASWKRCLLSLNLKVLSSMEDLTRKWLQHLGSTKEKALSGLVLDADSKSWRLKMFGDLAWNSNTKVGHSLINQYSYKPNNEAAGGLECNSLFTKRPIISIVRLVDSWLLC